MEKKRLFQVLDEMNVHDANNKTQLVNICPDIVKMNHLRKGTHVTMGVPPNVLNISHVVKGKKMLMLLIVDVEEYDKILNNE